MATRGSQSQLGPAGLLSISVFVLLLVAAGAAGATAVLAWNAGGNFLLPAAALGATLVAMGLILVLLRDVSARLAQVEAQNSRNQAAILQLLDEMADLAEGDLTVEASVTENFTGAIADSINFAIDEMRRLVSNINSVSVQVAVAAEETTATAAQVATAADDQARQITAASNSVNDMAASIDQVSANAAESAQVAQRSVEMAGNGSRVVQATTEGMDAIRGQISEQRAAHQR